MIQIVDLGTNGVGRAGGGLQSRPPYDRRKRGVGCMKAMPRRLA
jgi:hypothetical protein